MPSITPSVEAAVLRGFAHLTAAGIKFGPSESEGANWAKNYAYLIESAGQRNPDAILNRFRAYATGHSKWPSASDIINLKLSDAQLHSAAAQRALPAPEQPYTKGEPTVTGRQYLRWIADNPIQIATDALRAPEQQQLPHPGYERKRIDSLWHRIYPDGHRELYGPDRQTITNQPLKTVEEST